MKILLVAFLGVCVVYGNITPPTVTKCNEDVIRWVKVIWKSIGTPSGLVSGRAKDVKIGIIGSSEDYDTTDECETAEFNGETATWTLTNGKGEKSSYTETFTEDPKTPGLVTSEGGKIERYFVFSKGGVNAFYVCSPDGPEGDPQGAISVKLEPLDDDTWDLVDYAASQLSYVGVDVNETDVPKCFPKSN